MSDRRVGEPKPYSSFRPSRFFQDGCKWFFYTREGTIEGPFERKRDAENRLTDYVKVMVSGMLSETEHYSMEPGH